MKRDRSSYIDNEDDYEGGGAHSWAEFTQARLAWLYGNQNRKVAQAADIAAWSRLGRKAAA